MDFECLSQKTDLLSLISSLKNCGEPKDVVRTIENGIDLLFFYPIEDAEDLFKHVMPTIPESIKELYSKNNVMLQSKNSEVLEKVKNNLQVALSLTNISFQILDYILKHETVLFIHVSSVPVNMAQILFLTFEHCKDSQKLYQSNFKSLGEIFELFRKTQEVHGKFLNLLNTCLNFKLVDDKEVIAFKNVLELIIKISEMLSGINIKSMADNWKGYISLIQKYSSFLCVKEYNLSSAITSLTFTINDNMKTVYEMGILDLQKITQILKINGFLIKVVQKLFEIELNISENFHEIFNFCLMIYSWPIGFFLTNNFPDEVIETLKTILYTNTDYFMSQLFADEIFIKKLCTVSENNIVSLKHQFGLLNFSNEFLKYYLIENPQKMNDFEIVTFLHLIFNTTKNCYKEFFCDYNSLFYDDLVVNISATILLIPNNYNQIEKLLLESIIQERIWTALIAIDVWCMVLKYSTTNTCRLTLNSLIKKIQELNSSTFIQIPVIIRLKILTQRIFKLLPNNIKNEEVSKYNPSQNMEIWKILSLQDVPLSQRFHVEFILSDLYENIDLIDRQNCSSNQIVQFVETLDVISHTNFSALEINTSRLISYINRLWSFNVEEFTVSNNFSKCFILKLSKLTISAINELTGEHLLLILSQLKPFLNESLLQLLSCEIIEAIAKRNFNGFHEKNSLFSLISDIIRNLLSKNPIIVQITLEAFNDITENSAYESVVNKLAASSPDIKILISSFMRKSDNKLKYNLKYFEKIQDLPFRHNCILWTDSDLPQRKKLKVDDNGNDVIINKLKGDIEELLSAARRERLNQKQMSEIRPLINKLEALL